MTPFTIIPAKPRRRRKARPAAPAALTLVAVAFDAVAHRVDLTFDRPVGVASMDVTKVTVDDSDDGLRWRGSGTPTLLAPAVVRVPLTNLGLYSVPVTLLNAGPDTHLVAMDDAGTWPGVTDLVLPFP